MSNKIHSSSIKHIKDFSNVIDKWKNDIDNLDIITEISVINWNFLQNSDKTEIINFINEFSEILIILSLKLDQSKGLVELIIQFLKSEYTNKSINRKVFVYLVWKLYYSNPCLKDDFELTIKHMFPHHLSEENVIMGYFTCLLDLITPFSVDDGLLFPHFQQYGDLFIKDIRPFIMMELISNTVDYDSFLIKGDLQKRSDQRLVGTNSLISKLDNILCLIFDWMKVMCYTETELNWPATESLYRCVRNVYFKCILPCNLPNSVFHSHYIFSYLTSFYPTLAKNTCEYLWTLATDEKQTDVIRIAAVTNLCAYIAKFNFIKVDFLIDILTHIFSWCKQYGQYVTPMKCTNAKNTIFFEMFNGALYVFHYRHKEIIDYFGSIEDFTIYAERWNLTYLTEHPAIVLRQYPFREHLSEISNLIKQCRLGNIDKIVAEKVIKKPLKETQLAAMPFRYFFLPNSKEYITPYRVESLRHECIHQ